MLNTQNIIAKYYPKLLEAQFLAHTHFENVNAQFVIRTCTSTILLKKLWDSISLKTSLSAELNACEKDSHAYSFKRNFHVQLSYL